MNKIKIEKLDIPQTPIPSPTPKLKSILKKPKTLKKINLKGVRDPAITKHTIRLLTIKGHRRKDKTLKNKMKKLNDTKVSEIIDNSGLIKNKDMPSKFKRQILDHAVSAGFLSI
jgi:hypothetical protein